MYNLADACGFQDSRDRMIRDILIVGCNSTSARDKIVRKGEKITLNEVIELLQVENSTHQTLQEMNSTTQKVHYASYDKKKSKVRRKELLTQIRLILLLLILQHRNPLLQGNYASDARLHSAKNTLLRVRLSMPYVKDVV